MSEESKKAFGTDRISSTKINDTEFNPDKLADKILSFVNQAFGQQQNNDPNFDKAEFFSQVKQGVETGFSEARGALDRLGLLEGQQEVNLDAAYANIQEGLSRLESGDQASVAPVSQLQGFSAQINQSAEIEVVIKEGDVI